MQNQANCKVEQQGKSQRQSPTTATVVQVQNQGAKWSRMFTSASAGAVLGQRLAAEYHEPSDCVGDFCVGTCGCSGRTEGGLHGELALATPCPTQSPPAPNKKIKLVP